MGRVQGQRNGRKELRRDAGRHYTPGGGERRPSAGREREEGEAEIKKGSQKDGVWEGWPWAGETPGLRWGLL